MKTTIVNTALAIVTGLTLYSANAEEVSSKKIEATELEEVSVSEISELIEQNKSSDYQLLAAAYVDEAFSSPRVYYGGQFYYGDKLSSPVYVPSNDYVTSMSWEWNVNKVVPNTIAYLCSLTISGALSKCADVSRFKTGYTPNFFDSERAAGGFKFVFAVNNGGAWVDMLVTKTKVIVNHD